MKSPQPYEVLPNVKYADYLKKKTPYFKAVIWSMPS